MPRHQTPTNVYPIIEDTEFLQQTTTTTTPNPNQKRDSVPAFSSFSSKPQLPMPAALKNKPLTPFGQGNGIHSIIFIARRILASSRRGRGLSGCGDFAFDVLEGFTAVSMEIWVFECPGLLTELDVIGVLDLMCKGDPSASIQGCSSGSM
ncbi:hypothetical protein SCLCIDRAFT_30278 [Scleroderma citrinum Foug A]|uniref:Uncharacterized protein n=1 Tax=Scleroderma citrinum Foug A TaxID=1036808 RepID=A0A0C3DGV1_9AGAM|nr:hypothetical protein SCLCIDRAFT_30278 [Scleroderma citrinum Foug A]